MDTTRELDAQLIDAVMRNDTFCAETLLQSKGLT